jgi:hypothetical protein
MNYIRHLNAFFSLVRSDKRLTSTNVSLYFALFYYWNFNRFQNPFTIYRENILELSKLSKNTYHKSIKQLHDAKYIYYHPSASRFHDVRVSIVRLDKEEDKKSDFKQLNLFVENEEDPCRKIATSTVANLVQDCRKIDTGTVANLRHLYKPNNNKQNSVAKTPTEIFRKNEELNSQVNELAAVPNLRPTIEEIEQHFKENDSTTTEAHKFFYYNQGKNWMLTEKLPITDWKALANKWMINSPHHKITQSPNHTNMNETIQQLYDLYLTGTKINKYILPEFADHLKLEITDAIKQEAIQRRINQLSGSNETTTLNLESLHERRSQRSTADQ